VSPPREKKKRRKKEKKKKKGRREKKKRKIRCRRQVGNIGSVRKKRGMGRPPKVQYFPKTQEPLRIDLREREEGAYHREENRIKRKTGTTEEKMDGYSGWACQKLKISRFCQVSEKEKNGRTPRVKKTHVRKIDRTDKTRVEKNEKERESQRKRTPVFQKRKRL